MSDLLNEIYLEPSDVSKYKIMVSYYTGMSGNILKELIEQPYCLKIDQSPYTEDLNKVLHTVFDRKNKIPMVRIDDLKFSAPKLLYNLDRDKIEKIIPRKYITIFLKDGTSNHEINFYLTNMEFPSGAYKNIQVKKGYIAAESSIIFKYDE